LNSRGRLVALADTGRTVESSDTVATDVASPKLLLGRAEELLEEKLDLRRD
jgi:hypothetical protein